MPSFLARLAALTVPSRAKTPAASASIDATAKAAESSELRITCVDWSPEQVAITRIDDAQEFFRHHRPSWTKARWIDVAGIGQGSIISSFGDKYQLHPLALEDVVQGAHRPKVEDYPDSQDYPGRLFIVARLVQVHEDRLRDEQISLFLGRTTLVTFQKNPYGVFDSIYRRFESKGSRLRANDASFLCYSLVDAIVDSYFPLLERYSERLEEAEDELLAEANQATLQKVHRLKRELVLLRRAMWPMREIVAQLQRDRHECLSETTLTYFRDVYDHCVQIIDLIETYHEIAAALTETYMSVISNRMNEIMKVLTVISTIFIPLTFLAGVYGMNMPIPENHWDWTYPVFWIICVVIALAMLAWFRRKDWI